MSETERITNKVYDQHFPGVPVEVANLGRLASRDELLAANPKTPGWARDIYLDYARREREEQGELMIGHPHANVLGEGEDKSEIPNADSGPMWEGAKNALIAEIILASLIVAVYFICKWNGWL